MRVGEGLRDQFSPETPKLNSPWQIQEHFIRDIDFPLSTRRTAGRDGIPLIHFGMTVNQRAVSRF